MKYFFPLLISIFPAITMAKSSNGIASLIGRFSGIVELLYTFIVSVAVLVFIAGILKYVVAKKDEDRAEAKYVIIYGIIVIFVMVSIWGLVNLLGDTMGLENNVPSAPSLPGRG